MKKLMFCCLIFALFISLCACGSISKVDEPATPAASEEPPAEKSATDPMKPASDYSAQLALLAASKERWEEITWFPSSFSFAVTDLDQNGRLELILTECAGSAAYSRSFVIEVTEDLTDTSLCAIGDKNLGGDFSVSDLSFITETTAYYNSEENMYTYAAFNVTQGGVTWNSNTEMAIWLKDGAVNELVIAEYSYEAYEDGRTLEKYYDMTGNEITAAEYETAVEDYFADCEKMTATFSWKGASMEQLPQMDEAILISLMEESWADFTLK